LRDVRDGVLLADLPDASEEQANRVCVALGERLRSAKIRGVLDAIPGARSLLILFDPAHLTRKRLSGWIASASAREGGPTAPRRVLRLPVAYGGPDLSELASRAAMPPEEFARRHAEAEYRVAFIGFAPGFAYLTGLPPELHAARLRSPRIRVPAGSVAIGGSYTGIYPASSPGGWRLIGQTTVRLFDPDADPPALLRAGDRVRFEAVRLSELPDVAVRARPASGGRPIFRATKPGLATTIQGGPGYGLGSSGVPAGGAMDRDALARANALVGNAAGEAGLEMGLVGPELEVLAECVVAIAGADFAAEWNGQPVARGVAWPMATGDRLRLPRARAGARAYLAVEGGLESPGRHGPPASRLAAGEILTAGVRPPPPGKNRRSEPSREPSIGDELRLRVTLGLEAGHFAPSELDLLFAEPWRVSAESDRRGLRLEGPPLSHRDASEIPPSGTVAGSIQVPGNGLPIVLGPDGPVTGGYPRIATVIGADLCLLGQAGPGAVLRFAPVSIEQALEARRSFGCTMSLP
jgi:KipI family sensor histidine kinase inhibitor